VGLLLERGAILDVTSRDGTALSSVVNGRYNAVVKLLLEHHVNLKMKGGNSFGEGTPLLLAAAWGHISTVLQLLESGADINVKGKYRQIALERVRVGGYKVTVKVLKG
jgi:ankyrin repeat protein